MKSKKALIAIAVAGLCAGAGAAWGLWPRALPALDDFDRYVFVPSRQAPEVTVIDSKTDRIVATLDVGAIPGQIVVSEEEAMLVASSPEERKLILVDLVTHKIETVLPLEITPDHMQLSPDGYLLAIGDVGAGRVSVVSLHERREFFHLDGFSEPYNFTFSEDGSLIYVANRAAEHVSVIAIAQGRVIDKIAAVDGVSRNGVSPAGLRGVTNVTRTPSGRFGFATFKEGDGLTVLDFDNGKPIKTLSLGKRPWRAYGTADGRFMLVPNNGARTVSVIDTATLDVVATLPGAGDVTAVNTGWFDSVAFVMSRGEHKAVMIDLMDLKTVGEIALPGPPGPGVVTPDGVKLYVALGETNKVAVINARKRELVTIIDDVGHQPWGATMGRTNNYCH